MTNNTSQSTTCRGRESWMEVQEGCGAGTMVHSSTGTRVGTTTGRVIHLRHRLATSYHPHLSSSTSAQLTVGTSTSRSSHLSQGASITAIMVGFTIIIVIQGYFSSHPFTWCW